MPELSIAYVTTLPLRHTGDCNLIGVAPDKTIYAEEVYGGDGWLAQHALTFDGTAIQSVDELDGTANDLQPLPLPPETVKPRTGWHTMALNFSGPRHRGLRAPERTADLVHPLTLDEKMLFIQKLKLNIIPPLLLGIAESYVLAEAEITRPNLYFVCRRIRLALALPEERLDADHQPYDYDTHVLYLAHFYDCGDEPPVTDLLADLTAVPLNRPMDCLFDGDHLFIADGGDENRLSAIHIWKIERPPGMSKAEAEQKKIYG